MGEGDGEGDGEGVDRMCGKYRRRRRLFKEAM
jgi:hypothetical protein